MTAHANADGRQVVFGLAGSGTLFHNWQTAPSGPWSGWYAFGNPDDDASLTHVAAGVNSDGRLAVVAADTFGIVWYNAQVAPSQGWGAWVHVPGVMDVTTVAVARQRNGFLLLFANGGGTLSVCTQTPSGWTRWQALTSPTPGLAVETFAVGTNYDGRIEVAATFADNSVANIFQTAPNGSWSSWEWIAAFDTSDSLDGIAMARQEGGWLTTIVSGTSGDLFYRYQQAAGEATPSAIVWSQWARIANPAGVAVDRVTLAHDGDGRLQVFAIGSDLALWHLTQSAINVPRWNPWVSLGTEAGGGLAGQPAIGRNADGRLDAFVPTSAGSIGYVSQAQPTSRLAWFEALVAAVAPLVHLHPDELYMPASFDRYIGQTQYVDANGTEHGPLAPANLTWPAFGTGGYLTYAWVDPQIAFGDLAHAVCYAHVRSSTDWSLGGGYDIQVPVLLRLQRTRLPRPVGDGPAHRHEEPAARHGAGRRSRRRLGAHHGPGRPRRRGLSASTVRSTAAARGTGRRRRRTSRTATRSRPMAIRSSMPRSTAIRAMSGRATFPRRTPRSRATSGA